MKHLHINKSQFISRPGQPSAPFLGYRRYTNINYGKEIRNKGEKEIKVSKKYRNGSTGVGEMSLTSMGGGGGSGKHDDRMKKSKGWEVSKEEDKYKKRTMEIKKKYLRRRL
jgi:hypothetical protein